MQSRSQLNVGIYWFRHDLRLHDNESLMQLCQQVDNLLCIFVVDPRWFKASHYQSTHMGTHRWQFLQQSLLALQSQLNAVGQRLLVFKGEQFDVVKDILTRSSITHISSGLHPGVYERQQWQRLRGSFPEIQFNQSNNHCLFEKEQLPFELRELPCSFTPFRKKVEDFNVTIALKALEELPSPSNISTQYALLNLEASRTKGNPFEGGIEPGEKQLNFYLWDSHKINTYKQTRNSLQGWEYSSKLSAWLANGSISARQVYHQIKEYERAFGENESTYWLYFELLWREYFQWYLFVHQSALFRFEGVKNNRPLTTFMAQRFMRWKQGETPFPIVNACMKQLNKTGFMSNRGRQLVASCLVHELGLDWRYGAAYFEQQLIDFDVASNWGNWQYLAGVGADPRGHRKFDLEKQSRQYDPDGQFVNHWKASKNTLPLDDVDAADWPL